MSIIHISKNAYDELKTALTAEGHSLSVMRGSTDAARRSITVSDCFSAVSEPISCHPDIFLCKLGSLPKSPVFHGDISVLGPIYPKDVPFNAVVTEKYIICNTKTVSLELINCVKALYPNIQTIHVTQGYTKCNMVVIDENHFITEDEGIYKSIINYKHTIDDHNKITNTQCDDLNKICSGLPSCLLIKPGYVNLPGYERGFIGGSSGRIRNDIWFNGDISVHPDFEQIKDFISNCGLEIKYNSGKQLADIGSMIEEYT